MLVTFLSHRPWSGLSEDYRELIGSFDRLGPTVLLSPEADADSPIRTLEISLNRPLELQVDVTSISEEPMVLVALHPSVEPVTHSRALPLAWVTYEKRLTAVEPAVSLATRAGLVVAPKSVRSWMGVPDSKGLDEASPANTIRERLVTLRAHRPSYGYDAVLGAQVFYRREEVRRILEGEAGEQIPAFRRAKLDALFDLPGEVSKTEDDIAAVLIDFQRISEGKSLAGVRLPESVSELPPFVAFLTKLARSESQGEVFVPAESAAETCHNSYRRAWFSHLGRMGSHLGSLSPDQAAVVVRSFSAPIDFGALTPGLIAALPQLILRSGVTVDAAELFRHIADADESAVAMSAELMLIQAGIESGEDNLPARIDDLLARVDAHSRIPRLWGSATSYWRKMTGTHWQGEPSPVTTSEPTVVLGDAGEEHNDLVETNTRAQQALASGDVTLAIQLFARVRELALAENPVNVTQEMAARLNLGWSLWMDDRPDDEWRPLIIGILEETAPNRQMIALRAMCAVTAETVRSPEGKLRALERTVAEYGRSRNATTRIRSLLDEVDSLARHPRLWISGNSYWHKITGRQWTQEEVYPAPDVLFATAEPVGVEKVARLDRSARRALRRHRRKRAIRLFEAVRTHSLQSDPPLITTEQAARLNIGWAMWKGGATADDWAPYITSVLNETGPEPDLIEIRRRAHELLLPERGHK